MSKGYPHINTINKKKRSPQKKKDGYYYGKISGFYYGIYFTLEDLKVTLKT